MIKRMQIPRQLYNEGGISSVPLRRENFGLGSKFKKFVRKIIPKEVAQVAVKAAPFVAPFNPAIAGAMSGLGTFQQTGRMGKSLTAGGLNYAGGQAARYLGGAGFQGNPFTGGGAFTPSGFMGGFSSPLGTDTGLGKFLSDRRIARQPGNQFANARQAMTGNQAYTGGTYQDPIMTGGVGTKAGTIPQAPQPWSPGVPHSGAPQFPNQPPPSILAQQQARPYQDRIMRMLPGGSEPRPDLKMIEETIAGQPYQDRIMDKNLMDIQTKGAAATSQKALGSGIVEKVKTALDPSSINFDFTKVGSTIKDLGGKALNAVFRKEDGSLDKTAIMAALVTIPTFFEARALANEAGLGADEFTEEMFTAAKADSKKTYESNLGSFFEGTGYTGNLAKGGLIRENYAFGTGDRNKMSKLMLKMADGTISKSEMIELRNLKSSSMFRKGGRVNYAFGPDPDEFPETGDDITIFELIKEQGIPIGEQVRDKKIDAGAKSIQLAKITDKQRQQIEHDWPFLEAGGYDLNDLWKNAKGWDDKGSKGFWGMGKKEAEPMTKEEFKEEMSKRGYLDVPGSHKSIKDFDRLEIKKGGRVKYALGTPPTSEGGLGGLPVEADMRYTGGFMPYGEKEKADDVPARLSKNEFVFTADAVRAAGGGSMQKGAQRMYNTMKMLEGQVR